MPTLHKIQKFLILAVLFLFPLVFTPFTQEYFTTTKIYFMVGFSIVALILAGIELVIDKKYTFIKSPLLLVFGFLLLSRIATFFISTPNKIQALYMAPSGLIPFASLCVFLCVAVRVAALNRKHDEAHELPLLPTFLFGGTIAALISIVWYFQPFKGASLPLVWSFLSGARFSTLGNSYDTLAFLGFLLTASVVGLFIHMKKSQSATHAKIQQTIIAVVLGIAVALIVNSSILQPASATNAHIQLPPFGVSWNAVVDTLKKPQTAFLGVGLNNYQSLFTLTKPVSYNETPLWQTTFSLSRSNLLHVWAETGLVGFIIMLALILFVIREVQGLYAEKDHQAPVFAALGIYLFVLFAGFPASFITWTLLVVYIAALVQRGMQYDDSEIVELAAGKLAFMKPILALLCIAMALGTGFYAQRAYASEMAFKGSIDALRGNDGRQVYAKLQEAIKLNPYDERYRAQFSQINLLLANNLAKKKDLKDQDRKAISQFVAQAISEAKTLVALNPNKSSSWNNLAVIYRSILKVAKGADSWTVASYQEAIKRDPNNPSLRLNLGGVFYAAGKYETATTLFQQAVGLKPNWANAHYNLAWALYKNGHKAEAANVMKNVLTLLDKKSPDYAGASENAKMFSAEAEKEQKKAAGDKAGVASGSAQVTLPENITPSVQQPLSLPASPAAQINPQLNLPESSGPEK